MAENGSHSSGSGNQDQKANTRRKGRKRHGRTAHKELGKWPGYIPCQHCLDERLN